METQLKTSLILILGGLIIFLLSRKERGKLIGGALQLSGFILLYNFIKGN